MFNTKTILIGILFFLPVDSLGVVHLLDSNFDAFQAQLDLADSHFKGRENIANAHIALNQYRQLATEHEDEKGEVSWRISMACYFVGFKDAGTSNEKIKLFEEGIRAADFALFKNKNCSGCYFWKAINLALLGERKGVVQSLFMLKEIRRNLLRSIELDPYYAGAGAYRLLGVIEESLPGLLGGSNDKAIFYFEKAISLVPNEPLNYHALALLHKKHFHQFDKAKQIAIQGVAAINEQSYDRFESREAILQIRQMAEGAAP